MTNRQYRRRVKARSTWKKPVASVVAAWACKNPRQLMPACRCGAGGIGRVLRTRRIVDALTRRAEFEQLALDPLVSPAVVLDGEPLNERGDVGADWRRSRPVWVGPLPGDQAPVPSQDGAGCDQPGASVAWRVVAGSARRGQRGRPGPAGAGDGCGAARRPGAAARAARCPWTPWTGRARPASRRAGRRSGRADGETRLITIPDAMSRLSTQVTGASRLVAPHKQDQGNGGNMVKVTKQYSSAASQAGKAVEKTADIWTRGVREIIDSTYRIPKLPQVDLVPAVERYFDFAQRTVDANRGLSVRWARKAATLSDTVRERAESAGDAVRERPSQSAAWCAGRRTRSGRPHATRPRRPPRPPASRRSRPSGPTRSGHRKPASSSARGQGRLISAPASVTRA